MSMNAVFVQVDEAELAKIEAEPASAERLFVEQPSVTLKTENLQAAAQALERALSRYDPAQREILAQRLGLDPTKAADGADAASIFTSLLNRRAPAAEGAGTAPVERARLSLDKAWHGVHYVLCGVAQLGRSLLSQAVLGGTDIGDDDEGFSGYGPARYFTAQVAALSEALSAPDVEQFAAARFDAARMSALQIYPGWQDGDAEWVMDSLEKLRAFYADAHAKGNAIVTCLT